MNKKHVFMNKKYVLSVLASFGCLAANTSYGAITINELDADQSGTDSAEFIELYDGGVGGTSLAGHSLVFYNGSNDQSYRTVDLNNITTNAEGYFVICGNDSLVENCDLDLATNTNLIQNGADAVALYQTDASAFPNGSAITISNLVSALVYDTNDSDDSGLSVLLTAGTEQINENNAGNKDFESIQACSQWTTALPTPGMANQCELVEPVDDLGACGDTSQNAFQLISSVQGDISDISLDASPLLGQQVIVEAIVTTDLQGGTLANGDASYQYSGYWLQQEAADYDDNENTSEGIFVYDFSNEVNVGDQVRLLAQVDEFNQVTQLKSVQEMIICSQNNELPEAINLSLPVTAITNFEAVEGMLVSNNQHLVVSDLYGTGYGLGNYGQFVVSSKLHFQPTEVALPMSAEAQAILDGYALDVLLIDDGVAKPYPSFIPFPDNSGFSADNPMRIGYSVPQVSGVMNAYRNNYTLIPSAITIDPTHARTAEPVKDESANLIIAGMNVLNYFNGDGLGGGYPTARGARSADAFEMQSAKIVAALQAIDADIIGLMELENDGFASTSAIQNLVNELNQVQVAGNEYRLVNPFSDNSDERIGSDAITVGLLYRPNKVSLIGETVILNSNNSPVDDAGKALFDDSKNRPSLIQSFDYDGQEFTLSVNHLKSKGSACGEINEGEDGQANCNIMRTRAAQGLSQFLATNPTGINSDEVMILGDLNAYSQEDPMQAFYTQGFTNLKYTDKATEPQPYSYSFSGFLGSLDHALASDSLLEHVVSVDAWHINSVEDSLMDYQTEENGQRYDSIDNYAAADAYRSSDHDPIVIALDMPGGHWGFGGLALMTALAFNRRSSNRQGLSKKAVSKK
jgi:predicted extracellular nuclease